MIKLTNERLKLQNVLEACLYTMNYDDTNRCYGYRTEQLLLK